MMLFDVICDLIVGYCDFCVVYFDVCWDVCVCDGGVSGV